MKERQKWALLFSGNWGEEATGESGQLSRGTHLRSACSPAVCQSLNCALCRVTSTVVMEKSSKSPLALRYQTTQQVVTHKDQCWLHPNVPLRKVGLKN